MHALGQLRARATEVRDSTFLLHETAERPLSCSQHGARSIRAIGNFDHKLCPFADLAGHGDTAAHQLHKVLHDGEAESRSSELSRSAACAARASIQW